MIQQWRIRVHDTSHRIAECPPPWFTGGAQQFTSGVDAGHHTKTAAFDTADYVLAAWVIGEAIPSRRLEVDQVPAGLEYVATPSLGSRSNLA